MVGSGGGDRSNKEAVGMMALHEALRAVCLNSDWIYSVFWTIRPRPRVRGGNGCKVGDDNGSLMLMWEDGYCRGRGAGGDGFVDDAIDHHRHHHGEEDPVRKAFSKMSIQLYNYGEGLMGKVASDKCHKWVFKDPSESEPNVANYWQSSFDALPPEWTDQFESGIQTIAVIQAGHGLLQLGSCKIIAEDLHFVLRMRHTFESLGYQSGFYISQLFSSSASAAGGTRNNNSSSSPSSIPSKQSLMMPPIFNWGQRPMPPSLLSSPSFQNPERSMGLFPPQQGKTEEPPPPHMFLLPHSSPSSEQQMMMGPGEHEGDIKWPNGLSFFSALTGRTDVDAKLLSGNNNSDASEMHDCSNPFSSSGGSRPDDGCPSSRSYLE